MSHSETGRSDGHPRDLDAADATERDAAPQPVVIHQPEVHGSGRSPEAEPLPGDRRVSARRDEDQLPAAAPPVDRQGAPPAERTPPPVAAAPAGTQRAYSIDALRGLFLLLMTLGFTIQAGMFPDWMYHRQTPPSGDVVDIAGIAWRDLAYAAFIFTMAAALPITLSRKLSRGATEMEIVGTALRRGLLLFIFALMIGHSNTFFIGYTQTGRLIAIAGFIIMFAMFTRRRDDWNERAFNFMRATAWIAAIAFLALTPLLYDETFSPARRDQVIAELAFVAVAGSLVWYFTRHHLNARLGVLGIVIALYLGARGDGWISDFWWASPVPWLVQPSYLSLLAVVIPGTIAGDQVLAWMRAPANEETRASWSTGRIMLLAGLTLLVTPVVVIGLYNRWVAATTQLVIAMSIAGLFLVHGPRTPGERMLRSLFLWGAVWLVLGLLLDPFEDGIRKVPETLSYFFTVTGVTIMLLVAFSGVVDMLRREKWVRALIDVGHNPMLCYILFTVLLNSAFELVPAMRSALRESPGASILRSLLTVVLVVVIVREFSRRRIYWRT